MTHRGAARPRARRLRATILASLVLCTILVAGVLLIGANVSRLPFVDGEPGAATQPRASGSGIAATQVSAVPTAAAAAPPAPDAGQAGPQRGRPALPRSLSGAGRIRNGRTVFDSKTPAVANLDPVLLAALRRAATAAAGDDVTFHVNSGWRSPAYQEQLLRAAISHYGSRKEAARWVATPQTSPHVSGDAVDLGPPRAAAWLSGNGSPYGLCQIYRNEPWHYELRPQAVGHGCPPMYADPAHDPRMHR